MNRVFFYRDLTAYFYPMPELAWRMVRQGQLPLWNPYSGLGTPLAAMADLLLFYPGTWLRFLLGLNFFIIAHFILAGVATYALARKLQVSRAAATAAGLAFALSGPLLSLGSMLNVLVAASWMPVCLLAAIRACESPGLWRISVLGAALGMQALGGEPLFSMATAALALALLGLRSLRVLVPAALYGMGLIAVQILPSLELLRASVRMNFTFADSSFWSLHPLSLMECLIPLPLGGASLPLRTFLYGTSSYGPQPYLPSLYIGLLPLGLAIWASHRQAARVAAVAGVFLAFAFGAHAAFYTVFYELLPFVRQSRFPSKMMAAVALAAALLAGWGFDALAEHRRFQFGWVKWAIAVAAGLAIRVMLAPPWLWEQVYRAVPAPVILAHAGKLAALAITLVAFRKLARYRAAVLVVLAADLALSGVGVNPTAPAELFQEARATPFETGARIDSDIESVPTLLPVREGWSQEALAALEVRQSMIFGAPLEGVRYARDLSPNKLFTPQFHAFRLRVKELVSQRRHRELGRYNIRYFITRPGPRPPGVREAGVIRTAARRLAVWEIEDWRPRAEIAGGQARIVAEAPTRVQVEVESSRGGILILRDSFAGGWRARVDGKPAAIERAEEIFRGVRVPPGGHTVEFAYRPWSFILGASLSGAAVLLFAVAAGAAGRSKNQSSNTPA